MIALVASVSLVGCVETQVTQPGANVAPETVVKHENDAASVIAKAKTVNAEAKKLSFEWTVTAPAIKKAEKALESGDHAGAMKHAQQALLFAEGSVEQAKREKAMWKQREINMLGK